MAEESEPTNSSSVIVEDRAMEHECDLAERIGDLLFDDRTADMMLVVEGEYLSAHRAILSTSCEFFSALLHGKMKESLQNEVVLEDVPLRGFKLVMSYIYTGQLRVEELDEDTLVEVLLIAHMYGITKLETSLAEHIRKNLSLRNVCIIYNNAYSLKLEELSEVCYRFMIQEPNVTLKTEAFCDISEAALCHMLSQDTFHADEIEIFKAVLRWRAKRQSEKELDNVLTKIRLPLIDTKDLVTTLKDSGLISTELLMDAIKTNECHATDKNFRGSLREGVNLATSDCGALRLKPKIRGKYIVSRSCLEYDSEDLPPLTSELSFPAATGFTLALSEPFFVNHIEFELAFECCYYIEVSVNLIDWARVIDFSKHMCGLLQNLYFERRVVRYIRLIGTETNRADNVIKITNLGVYHTRKPFKLSQGFYAPEENVASSKAGAAVIKSLDKSEALIDYDDTDNEDDSGWTSHKIDDGSIMIQFPHPYTVSSMRMLLRSDESRSYLYYVETSLDSKTWTRVADRTSVLCRSWQEITFEPLPVVFINIVGTKSTVDTEFSCGRFECPAVERYSNKGPAREDVDVSSPSKR